MPTVRGRETDSPKLLLEDVKPDAMSKGGAGDYWRGEGWYFGRQFLAKKNPHKKHKKTQKQKHKRTI